MRLDTVAAPLAALLVALPFVSGFTQPPNPNFWPVAIAWACAAVLAAVLWLRAARPGAVDTRTFLGVQLALGLVLAGVLGGGIGLLQYFGAEGPLAPWVQASTPGQAIGNLRQRNQQASLLSLAAWAGVWLVAQWQGRALLPDGQGRTPLQSALPGGGTAWPSWLAGAAVALVLAWLAVSLASTASRTGTMQWLLLLALAWLWRRSLGRTAPALVGAGLMLYLVAAWLLPGVLMYWVGGQGDDLFARFMNEGQACNGRRVLWSNMATLIAQKPWTGWGWGELAYAHYMTQFPGPRFCALLDNAHNLPLHLAVELGLPVALLACGAVLAWLWRARPWRETEPLRQLAWGVLAVVGLHSLLEFPLWYGPFQVASVLALLLLWWPRGAWAAGTTTRGVVAGVWLGMLAVGGYAAWEYHRVSQVYLPADQRMAAYREDPLRKASDNRWFAEHVQFARVNGLVPTAENATLVYPMALAMLHFSPEPRVIERVIESAVLLGRDGEAAAHLLRYRSAYPDDYARWSARNTAAQRRQAGAADFPWLDASAPAAAGSQASARNARTSGQ